MLPKPDIGKRQLEWDRDADATAALAAGWHIDNDDWWVRTQRVDDTEIPGNDCSVGDGIVLAPAARDALDFDAAMATRR